MINTVKTDWLAVASWAYLSNGEAPAGYTAIPGVSAGAYVREGSTPPPSALARRAALSALEDENGCPTDGGEALLFDGSTVEREGRVWWRFETLSSMPMRGLVAPLHDWIAVEEDDAEDW
ncbi:hypothetical protein [Actinomycetospora cinnamomea]|uniref:Uncharacterized protein n=1 Tax=Actinomycetospora cinnamomea TaxID=663609 RepID=A0A2U1FDC8_9PSEU|nr:hypothetical protein [Actinomycetospora cinnamomea]PVZ10164.1 hypothetical protein C8D89_105241 [Actinomycetospora cinnamomea]